MATVSDPRFEIRDPRFESESARPGEPRPPSPWRTCFIGCLVVAVVAMLLLVALGVWVARNWRGWVATGATEGMNQMIEATDLPAQEKQEIKVEVQRLADAFREGKVSGEQVGQIVEEILESPLFTLFVVSALEKQYLERSGLSDEEKDEGRQTLRRFVRGAMDKKIGEPAIDAVMTHVAEKDSNGDWQMKDRVSDDELRAALKEAKRAADEADIPVQPDEFDASAEFKRIVDEAMNPAALREKDATKDTEITEKKPQ
jgi:hypothetical protein